MARRRLTPTILEPGPIPGTAPDVPRAEHQIQHSVPRAERAPGLGSGLGAGAPIARIAAETAERAALDEVVETLRRAEAEGRMVLEIPLGDIALDHIARDRVTGAGPGSARGKAAEPPDEDMAALIESLRAHGQRMPVEVVALRGPASEAGADGGFARGRLPWGLISGWRRLTALRALHAETGDPRFATARALVRRPGSAAAAYVAMVEENEVRLGLSQYERARIAAEAVARGVFEDEGAAIRALFAGASPAKRSRIRAFAELHRGLGGALRFPRHLPERLGLRLVECLRAGGAEAILSALELTRAETPEMELHVLETVAETLEERARTPRAAAGRAKVPEEAPEEAPGRDAGEDAAAAQPEAGGDGWRWERLGPGLELGFRAGPRAEIRLRGAGVGEALRARIAAALREAALGEIEGAGAGRGEAGRGARRGKRG